MKVTLLWHTGRPLTSDAAEAMNAGGRRSAVAAAGGSSAERQPRHCKVRLPVLLRLTHCAVRPTRPAPTSVACLAYSDPTPLTPCINVPITFFATRCKASFSLIIFYAHSE